MEPQTRNRVTLFALAVACLGVAIAARLVQLQIFRAEELGAQARSQHEHMVEIGGDRGAILDRNGRELAVSVETLSLFAHPPRVSDPARAARLLARVLDMPEARLLDKLRSDSPFVWLMRRMDPKTAKAVEALGLPLGGDQPFGFEAEGKRFYPQGSLAVQVVGFANIDQVGVEGIEKVLDGTLRGDPARYLAVRDGRGGMVLQRALPAGKQPEDVVLSLDLVLQHIVERELDAAWRETRAKAAAAILLDPATGEILALANRPTADPNRYGEAEPEGRRNRAVVDQYEPGSTFKVITASAALDRGTVTPEQRFDCQNGSIQIFGRRVQDVHAYGVLTVREIVEKSSNVGIIKVGRTLPRETLRDYIVRFGFGRKTGIDLPGECPGMVTPLSRMSGLSPSSMAMGYELGVTALQMVSAVSAVANDGVLVPPRVVLGTRDASGVIARLPLPEPRQVISGRTAATMAGILEGVVVRGTGKSAAVPGYRIAGKTGTARKVIPGVGYAQGQFMASFVGFAPLRSPRLAGIVVIDTPSAGAYYGGAVSAPVLGRIFADALAYLRVPPDEDPMEPPEEKPAPAARLVARDDSGSGKEEEPRAAFVATAAGQVPDVRGKSVREAVVELGARGYRARVEGKGTVVDQSPAPGTPLATGEACTIRLGTPREPGPEAAPLVAEARGRPRGRRR